jgi:hypothetical protein
MALAEKISRIWDEQEKTKQKFMAEVYQNMQQIDAMKTQREVENRQKLEREQLRKAQTITGTQTTLTDTGQTITTAYESGRTRMDVTEDKRTPKPVAPTYREIKSGDEIITLQNGKEIARSPRFKETQKEEFKLDEYVNKQKAQDYVSEITKTEGNIAAINSDITTTTEEIDAKKAELASLGSARKTRDQRNLLSQEISELEKTLKYYNAELKAEQKRYMAATDGLKKLGKKKTSADVGTTGNNRLTDDERNQANNITGKLGF